MKRCSAASFIIREAKIKPYLGTTRHLLKWLSEQEQEQKQQQQQQQPDNNIKW